MLTLKLQTGKAFTGANVLTETTLDIYNKGLTIAQHENALILDRIAKDKGFDFVPCQGWLFGGYYRNLKADLYMAIV